jgi:flagellar export protein FliJ
MGPFRFRAASALDLRKRQEDLARQALVRAQNAASLAEAACDMARRHADEARARLVALQEQGAPAWLIGWHRSWIVQQGRELEARRHTVALATATLRTAQETVRGAHVTRRVLERLRDRLARRHAQAAERYELTQMNELAGQRYLTAAAARKEQR